jgi:heme/copper-type cytochrome/quinol oxidase subunit 2
MFQPERLATVGFAARRRPNGLVASVMWVAGLIAAVAAMAVGAVLAVFTAAAVAMIALIAGVVVFFAGLAMRARRNLTPRRRAGDPDVIEARKVDGTWVAYGWERNGR